MDKADLYCKTKRSNSVCLKSALINASLINSNNLSACFTNEPPEIEVLDAEILAAIISTSSSNCDLDLDFVPLVINGPTKEEIPALGPSNSGRTSKIIDAEIVGSL